jgi:hypothetical protein
MNDLSHKRNSLRTVALALIAGAIVLAAIAVITATATPAHGQSSPCPVMQVPALVARTWDGTQADAHDVITATSGAGRVSVLITQPMLAADNSASSAITLADYSLVVVAPMTFAIDYGNSRLWYRRHTATGDDVELHIRIGTPGGCDDHGYDIYRIGLARATATPLPTSTLAPTPASTVSAPGVTPTPRPTTPTCGDQMSWNPATGRCEHTTNLAGAVTIPSPTPATTIGQPWCYVSPPTSPTPRPGMRSATGQCLEVRAFIPLAVR